MKECRECHQLKDVTEFRTTVVRGKEYLRSQCKHCQNKIRNLQHRDPKYRIWRNERIKRQYHRKKDKESLQNTNKS